MARKPTLLRIYALAKGRLPKYAISLVLIGVMGSATQVATGLLIQTMFDAVVRADPAGLIRGMFVFGGAFVAFVAARTSLGLVYQSCATAMTGDLRKRVFHHLQRLPIAYYDRIHSGDLVSRLTNDMATLEPAYTSLPLTMVGQVAGALGALGYIASLDRRLALYMIAVGVLTMLPGLVAAGPLRRIGADIQKGLARVTERLSDILAGGVVVRTYCLGPIVMENYHEENERALSASMRQVCTQATVNLLISLPNWMGQLGLLALGVFLAMRQSITIGAAVGALGVYVQVVALFGGFSRLVARLQESLAGADRLLEILDTEVEPDRCPEDHPVDRTTGPGAFIEFRNVFFSYGSRQDGSPARAVLDDLTFSISARERLALVGRSGSGKTTVINLLLGFYAPQRGSIRVAGASLAERRIREIRELTAFVPQDAYLFSGSVLENIRYGRPGVADEEVIEAAKAANAHDFITVFPQGYNTPVGERGTQVSGGQRQRIAIARAILRDAPALLLDEATSSLDSESERLVQEALRRLAAGRTTLVVAHRLSTILDADRIVVLDGGRIVQSGTHAQLMADTNGLYRRLYDTQFTGPEGGI